MRHLPAHKQAPAMTLAVCDAEIARLKAEGRALHEEGASDREIDHVRIQLRYMADKRVELVQRQLF